MTTTKKPAVKKPATKKAPVKKVAATKPLVDMGVLPVDSDLLINAITYATIFASKDQTRPILNAVCFTVKGGELTLEATDSYALIHIEGLPCATPDGQFIVPLSTLTTVLRFAGKKSPLTVTHEVNSVTFTVTTGEQSIQIQSPVVTHGAGWPITDAMKTVPEKPTGVTALTNTTLGKVSTLLRKMSARRTYPAAQFTTNDTSLGSVHFKIVNHYSSLSISGCVMPVRVA